MGEGATVMKKIIINGIKLSTTPKITGVQRVCREILIRLDKLLDDETELKFEYVYCKGANNTIINPFEFRNIVPVEMPGCGNDYIIRLFTLPKYVRKRKAIAVCVSTEVLRSKNHIACVHDLRPVIFKDYDSFHFKLTYKYLLHTVKKYSKKIVAVSDFQKNEIIKYFKIKEADKVKTIYNGWEHMKDIVPDGSIFGKYSKLKVGEYFYSLGSLAPHKNFKWILETAKRNPHCTFAIAGGKDLRNWKDNIETDEINNVIFLGYVSDEENKALMQNCKAFLFPSKYEGFGIPPLEALSCGAPIIISNASCLPEIYEDCAHYFDPDDYDVDLDKILRETVGNPEKILKKCSWENAAMQWLEIIKKEIMQNY